jgi:hypothetical protein
VLANPKWQKAALALNLVGTIVLFYSFQATSSDFRLVTAPYVLPPMPAGWIPPKGFVLPPPGSKQYALCVNNYTLIESDARSGILMGHRGCPDWEDSKPAAVVNIEHPAFEGFGFFLLISGFTLQYFSVPQAATVAHLRQQIKMAQIKERDKYRQDSSGT